jgi:hypothetical protein
MNVKYYCLQLLLVCLTVSCVQADMETSIAVTDIKIQIEKGPVLDAGPNTYFGEAQPIDKTKLIDWLGGIQNIDKVLISTPWINENQQKLSDEYVINRLNKSIYISPRMWSYAPYTMGTIYLKNGTKINFEMFLSGIKFGKHLFAIKNL